MSQNLTLTVSQLNEYIGAIIDSAELLSSIYVKGEISNFTNHYKSGHFYFTLKDENGNLKAVMFRSNSCRVKFTPENGMKVTAHGRIAVYERDGIYQLYCDELIPDGIGALYLAYEQLKEKLSLEGIFDEKYKKKIPKFPEKIGIITSPTGAAIADLTNILKRRYPSCELELYPALVQGDGAVQSLISGILYFDQKVDTIIIGRGGGSIEDLWAFNDEKLARTIFKCNTPVISAVGHEIDFTICDFVADLRAPTPSAAAELAVPDKAEILENLVKYQGRLEYALQTIITQRKDKIVTIANLPFFKTPSHYIDKKKSDLLKFEILLNSSFEKVYNYKCNLLTKESTRLSALNPLSILSRGYSAVYNEENKVITSVNQINTGEKIKLSMQDGEVVSTVEKIIIKSKKED